MDGTIRKLAHSAASLPAAPNAAASVTHVTAPLDVLLRIAFPDATEITVADRTGGGDHFQVTVASPSFDGLTQVEQHRLVYDALAEQLSDGTIHELRITTRGGT